MKRSLLLLVVGLLTSLTVEGQTRHMSVHYLSVPHSGKTGQHRFYEISANGTDFFSWQAAASMAATTTYTLPPAFPASSGDVLSSSVIGVTSWIAPPGGVPSGSAGGSLSGSYPNPALAATQPDDHVWDGLHTLNSAAPVSDPAAGTTIFGDGLFGYRSATAGEGDGKTHRVHNRFEETTAVGIAYTFTASVAKVAFGTTSPEVTLPTAGTWLILARITIAYAGATTTGQSISVKIRNVTDSTDLAGSNFTMSLGAHTTITESFHSGEWSGIATVTAGAKNIQIFGGLSGLLSVGNMKAASGYMRAIRLF